MASADRGLVDGLRDHPAVEAEGVLVDLPVRLREGAGLAVGDHEDLAVRPALAPQQVPRELEPRARVRVEGAHLDAGDVVQANLPGLVPEHHDLQAVLGVARPDQLDEGEGDPLGGRDAVLAVEDHRVREVDQEDGRTAGEVLGLVDLEVLLLHREPAEVAREATLERVPHARGRIDHLDRVAEGEGARLRQPLVARAGGRDSVVAGPVLAEAREDPLEGLLSQGALAPGRHRDLPVGGRLDHPILLEQLLEVLEGHALGPEVVAIRHLLDPLESLLRVPGRAQQQLAVEPLELLDHAPATVVARVVLAVAEVHGDGLGVSAGTRPSGPACRRRPDPGPGRPARGGSPGGGPRGRAPSERRARRRSRGWRGGRPRSRGR